MEAEVAILNRFIYVKKEWTTIKFLFTSLWLLAIYIVLGKYNSQPFPEGICQFFNCAFFVSSNIRYLIIFLSIVFAVLYIMEIKMKIAVLGLSIISILTFSIERSNGIYHREELFSLVYGAQFIAYIRHKLSSKAFKNKVEVQSMAMFYSISVIVGSYMIAGITKLQTSGIYWVIDSPNIAVQILQSMEHKSIDNGLMFLIDYGHWLADTILQYPSIAHMIFTFAMCVELLAFIALFSKKHSFYYGLLLLFLHLGMFLLLFVKLVVFIWSVLILMVNIPQFFSNNINPVKTNK